MLFLSQPLLSHNSAYILFFDQTAMTDKKFYRAALPTADSFRQFLVDADRPKFGMTSCSNDGYDLFGINEWVFANDIESLMLAALRWEERGCYFEYNSAKVEELKAYGDDLIGDWKVIGVPSYFNECFRCDPLPSNGILPTQDYVRARYFERILKQTFDHDLFFLRSESYDRYFQDWKAEDS